MKFNLIDAINAEIETKVKQQGWKMSPFSDKGYLYFYKDNTGFQFTVGPSLYVDRRFNAKFGIEISNISGFEKSAVLLIIHRRK